MCYNYEALVRRGIERDIREHGYEAVMATLTDQEKQLWEQKSITDAAASESEKESISTFPGSEVQVIPLTTRMREFYNYGFLPDWAKSFNDYRKNYNARTDSVRIKPTWKKAWTNNQRCLVSASGFYEVDRSTKKRYYFTVKGREEIFFAGLFNHWTDRTTGEIFKTFAMITTEANELVAPIHNRMPVILDREGEITWLKPQASEENVFRLLRPFPPDLMEMKEVPAPPRKKKGGTELSLEF